MGLLLGAAVMVMVTQLVLTSAAAIGSSKGDSLCQLSSADTAEHVPILLKLKEETDDLLKGSAHVSNCPAVVFCVDGTNVTLPHRLEVVKEVISGKVYTSDITFSPSSAGNITATVTIDLWQLTEAIQQLSRRKFCCVDGVSQPNSAKCFMPELQFAPVQNMSAVVANNSSPVGGDSITLTCPLISNPPGNYSWALRSGSPAFNRSSKRELTLAPLRREHVGCYLCRVVSELGTADVDTCARPYRSEVEAHCESEEKAAIQVSAPQIEVEEGTTAVVNCSWSYLKLRKMDIDWLGPNKTDVKDTSFHSDDFTCMGWREMRIKNFTAAKEGDYTCRVRSDPFDGDKTVRLILAEPPNTTGVPLMYEAPPGPAAAVIVGVPVSLVVLLSAMLMVLLVVFVMWKRQRPMSDKEYVALPLPPREGFEYDVFLSYHDECDSLVRKYILGPLKAEGYKVCYHHDDFEPGVGIYDNIHGNMDKSRVAVLVLTKSYTSSDYCLEEMRYAKHAVRMSRTRRLLPVAWRKEEVPKELRDLTYLEVKEGQEEELAKDIRDWIGDPVPSSAVSVTP